MSLLKALQPLGAKNVITLLPVFENDTVTVTIFVRPKGQDEDDEKVLPPLQYAGPIDEVEEKLKSLAGDITAYPTLAQGIADLEQRKKDLEEETKNLEKRAASARASSPKSAKSKGGKAKAKHAAKDASTATPADVSPTAAPSDGVSATRKDKQTDLFEAAPADAAPNTK